MSKTTILVTGISGFIGYSCAKMLIRSGYYVIGIDNINNYYDTSVKIARMRDLGFDQDFVPLTGVKNKNSDAEFFICDICHDKEFIGNIVARKNVKIVLHLAAQAGVRYSVENPAAYIDSNIIGFMNIMNICREQNIEHFIFASSSSVYGNNKKTPFSVKDRTDSPVSLYAATKKSNEVLAHSYSCIYKMKITALRFFTVYGPFGRPDMAYYSFTDKIIRGEVINVYNNGKLFRDFTFIDDVVMGILRIVENGFIHKNGYLNIYNIGRGKPVNLMSFIRILETEIGKPAILNFVGMQDGDVYKTYSDTKDLEKDYGYRPVVDFKEGIKRYYEWYKTYYGI